MSVVDDLSWQILADVVADFSGKNLSSGALSEEYVGLSISDLEAKYCAHGSLSKVDFDLALKQIEENEFVKTGPMEPYDNKPGSGIFIMAIFSKREFVYLTEKGYKAAQKSSARRGAAIPTVHISGGTFHQSPIGVGGVVQQTVSFNDQAALNDLNRLVEVFENHVDELGLDATMKRRAMSQVSTIKAQLDDDPNPIIIKQAGQTLRNITEGAIAGLISTAVQPAIWAWVAQNMPNLFR